LLKTHRHLKNWHKALDFDALMSYNTLIHTKTSMNINGYEIKPDAYLVNANLMNANLEGANLRGAKNADLRGANLVNANLGLLTLMMGMLTFGVLTL
jgi:uncharacterized protein YjbI with pentapeptide repeats